MRFNIVQHTDTNLCGSHKTQTSYRECVFIHTYAKKIWMCDVACCVLQLCVVVCFVGGKFDDILKG